MGRTSSSQPSLRILADRERRVEVCGVNQVEAGQLFLGLCERAVRGAHQAVAHAHGSRSVHRPQGFGSQAGPGSAQVLVEAHTLFVRKSLQFRLIAVDQAQIFHDCS
jgi:hypothetical protein